MLQKGNVMSGMKNYKELDAWKLSMTMAETAYDITDLFPDRERHGLTAQLRKCAVSVPSNIAGGQVRGTARFGLFFIRVALGSVAEMDTQMELARRRMLYGMRREHLARLGTSAAGVVSVFLILRASGFFA